MWISTNSIVVSSYPRLPNNLLSLLLAWCAVSLVIRSVPLVVITCCTGLFTSLLVSVGLFCCMSLVSVV